MRTEVVRFQGHSTRQTKRRALENRELVVINRISQLMSEEESFFLVVLRSTDGAAIENLKHKGMAQTVMREMRKCTGIER